MAGEQTITNNTAAILLAAGSSSRLGRPKQLLMFEGATLLQHSIDAAKQSGLSPIIVVLGAHAETIKHQLEATGINIILNTNWNEGMASSIRVGIEILMKIQSSVEGAILMTCDQPFVSKALLESLMEAHTNTGKRVVTCSYADTYGPPVFFHQSIFSELLQLNGDIGARKIVKQHVDEVAAVAFPQGDVDVDTVEDYDKLSISNRR